ncbi:MAG: hypothetical protein OXC02_01970 [Rhodobacteraceae bacterium]|nr:hypothetical protein [Paracoccaceae bacterium]
MKKLVLPVIFAGLAFGASAGSLDQADMSDEGNAEMGEEMMTEEVVVEEESTGGGWNWTVILIIAALAGLAL